MELFRIKAATVKFSHGDEKFYYPQQKIKKLEKTGRLWWKKDVLVESWSCLYKDKTTGVLYISQLDNTELVVCSTIDEAKEFIKKEIEKRIINARIYYSGFGVSLKDDDKNVEIITL